MKGERMDEVGKGTFIDFELFQKVFGIKIVSIGLECPKCKRIWGFKVYGEKNITEVKQGKLVCFYCANGELEK
jgi:hypothetical protein